MPLSAQFKLQYHLPIMLVVHTENHMGKQYVQERIQTHFLLQGIFPTQGSNLCLLCLLH